MITGYPSSLLPLNCLGSPFESLQSSVCLHDHVEVTIECHVRFCPVRREENEHVKLQVTVPCARSEHTLW